MYGTVTANCYPRKEKTINLLISIGVDDDAFNKIDNQYHQAIKSAIEKFNLELSCSSSFKEGSEDYSVANYRHFIWSGGYGVPKGAGHADASQTPRFAAQFEKEMKNLGYKQ